MDKLDFLINYLLKENTEIVVNDIPESKLEKKKLYRSLCNIRAAKPISNEYLKIENDFLQEELQKKDITNVKNVQTISKTIKESNLNNKDKICLWQGDITTLQIDSIVNAANSQGLGCFIPCHKCIDNQINTFAGISLRLECNIIMKEKNYFLGTGKSFITKGYNLPAKHVIHTVGPIIYDKVTDKEIQELQECYINSLKLAKENKIRTIAFPCISTGEFRFPKEQASKIAIETVDRLLNRSREYFDKVIFNVYGEEDYKIYERNIRKC